MTINRPILVQKLVQRKHNGMIKIITGLRRSGKSYLLFNLFQNYLLQNNVPLKAIIKVDLEDFDAYPLREPRNLLDYISSATKDNDRYYIFIDEVQHLAHFEDVLNTLLKRGNMDVYVTGSNARFLSKDVVTTFRGRGDEIRVHPLSFAEYLTAFPDRNPEQVITDYMTYGGMPQLPEMPSNEQKEEYLKSLFTETYLTDIRERYRIQEDSDLEELIDLIASSIGSLQNPLKLQNTFKSIKQSSMRKLEMSFSLH